MKKNKADRKAKIAESTKKFLKGLIGPAILVLIIVAVVIVFNVSTDDADAEYDAKIYEKPEDIPSTYQLENDKLLFTLDTDTTQFVLKDKVSGKEWYSSPQDGGSDPIAQGERKSMVQSTLLLTYSDYKAVDTRYNSFDHAITNKRFIYETGDDYIKVTYTIGDIEREYDFPLVITEEEYNQYKADFDSKNMKFIDLYFTKYDVPALLKSKKEADKTKLKTALERYPMLRSSLTVEQLIEFGLTEEDAYELEEGEEPYTKLWCTQNDLSMGIKKKLEQVFLDYGYTHQDYLKNKLRDNNSLSSKKPYYNISMIYRLDGGDLLVDIPFDEIEQPKDYPIYQLTVLPYFGAGSTSEEGFLFVPEGGGAIIDFNNGKTTQSGYYANLYGWDMCTSRDALVHDTRAIFNAFGVSKNDSSFICIIEDGSAYASVQADISQKLDSYNYVNAIYTISKRDRYDSAGRAEAYIYSYQEGYVEGEKISQRYSFLNDGEYTTMAKDYRDYLFKLNEEGFTKNNDSSTPILIDILGAADKVEQVVGIPMSRPLELTNTDEATDIVKELNSAGLSNMSVKLTGFINGGIRQQILNSVKSVSKLGSKRDMIKMVKEMEDLGANVYLDGITDYAIDSDFWDGFNTYSDAAKFVNREKAKLYEYSATTFGQRDDLDPYYLLTADNRMKMIDNLTKYADKIGAGISFQNLGSKVSGDYTRKNYVSREQVLDAQSKLIKEEYADRDIMVNEGNCYAAPYATMISNIDFCGSQYTIIDRYIPFYQMALHGYVNYVGESLNLTGNRDFELLKSAEYGAGLQFTVMDETPFTLQNTLYYCYFGAEYDSCKEDIIKTYNTYNRDFAHIFNQEMVDHEFIQSDLTCTTYADGTKVYVNYSYNNDAEVNGTVIPARQYKVVK